MYIVALAELYCMLAAIESSLVLIGWLSGGDCVQEIRSQMLVAVDMNDDFFSTAVLLCPVYCDLLPRHVPICDLRSCPPKWSFHLSIISLPSFLLSSSSSLHPILFTLYPLPLPFLLSTSCIHPLLVFFDVPNQVVHFPSPVSFLTSPPLFSFFPSYRCLIFCMYACRHAYSLPFFFILPFCTVLPDLVTCLSLKCCLVRSHERCGLYHSRGDGFSTAVSIWSILYDSVRGDFRSAWVWVSFEQKWLGVNKYWSTTIYAGSISFCQWGFSLATV